MERDKLKRLLEPIVLDQSLTKEERNKRFLPIMKQIASTLPFEEASELWNNTVADIAIEHGLRRH